MHNPAPVLENGTQKLLWDFGRTHGSPNLRQKTKPYNNQRKKKKRICKIVDFAVPADHRIKLKECEKKYKYLELARGLKKLWNMKVTIIPIVVVGLGHNNKRIIKGLGGLGSWRMSGDHLNVNIIESGQNFEESPEDLRRHAVKLQ